MKSWKIGAVSGLIAGIVAGIYTVFIHVPMLFKLGLPYLSLPPPVTPFCDQCNLGCFSWCSILKNL